MPQAGAKQQGSLKCALGISPARPFSRIFSSNFLVLQEFWASDRVLSGKADQGLSIAEPLTPFKFARRLVKGVRFDLSLFGTLNFILKSL